jgi:hypothetical protein
VQARVRGHRRQPSRLLRGPSGFRSLRHRAPLTQKTRVQSALDDRAWRVLRAKGLADAARHVIGCISTQETRAQNVLDDTVSNIRQACLLLGRQLPCAVLHAVLAARLEPRLLLLLLLRLTAGSLGTSTRPRSERRSRCMLINTRGGGGA